MSDSSRKESFFDGKSGARLLQGLVVGVAATLIAGFGVSAWSRSEHLTKAGFVTFAGGKDPDYMVARECANMLGKSFSFE